MSEIKILNCLPSWCRIPGGFAMVFGLIAMYYFIYLGIKPEWLQLNVFTVYSKFLETTTFSFIKNNQGDEIAVFSYLAGFLTILFSTGKNQTQAKIKMKTKALINSLVSAIVLFLMVYFFIHGSPIIYLVVLFAFSIPLLYVIIYLFLRFVK